MRNIVVANSILNRRLKNTFCKYRYVKKVFPILKRQQYSPIIRWANLWMKTKESGIPKYNFCRLNNLVCESLPSTKIPPSLKCL